MNLQFLLTALPLLLVLPLKAQTVRYASPTGTATSGCTNRNNPCSLPAATSQAASGDIIELLQGTYVLDQPINPPSGTVSKSDTLRTVMRAAQGAHVEVNGLNITVQGTWSRYAGSVYRIAWQKQWTVPIPNADRIRKGEVAAYREQVVVGADPKPYLYSSKTDPAKLSEGEIYVEDDDLLHGSPSFLYIRLRGSGNPNNETVRMSTLWGLFNVNNTSGLTSGSYFHVQGITWRYGATYFGEGLLATGPGSGGGTIIEDCTVEWGNAFGIKMDGSHNIVRRNRIRNNGRGDLRGRGHYNLAEYNTTGGGNWKGYNQGNGTGNKFLGARHNTIRSNHFGPSAYAVDGLWLDESAKHNTIYGNRIDGVQRAGIFLEQKSDSNYVFSNVITRVRFYNDQNGGVGILVRGSAGNLVAYNTIYDNDGCVRLHYSKRAETGLLQGNLVINNACLDNSWSQPRQVDWDDSDARLTEAQMETNKADGNAYWPDAANGYFRFRAGGSQTTYHPTTVDFTSWRTERGFDGNSWFLDLGKPHITSTSDYVDGWKIPSNSQLRNAAIAIPDTSWWDVNVPLIDHLGNRRPNGGGDVGAHQYSHSPGRTSTVQTISLKKGWNIASASLEPSDASMEAVLADILPDIVLVKDQAGQIFSPAFNINTIGEWDPHEAYMIYAGNDVAPTIEGTALSPEQTQISLSEGWSLIPYLKSDAMLIEEALASILPDLMLVKDNAGRIYYPEFGINEIGNMQPGQGYWAYMNKPAVLTYSQVEAALSAVDPREGSDRAKVRQTFEPPYISSD